MSTAEFDARLGVESLPDLVSGPEAAQMLGLSRQRVLQMVQEGKLPGTLVGRSIVIPRAAVHAHRGLQQAPGEQITDLVDEATNTDRRA